MREDASKRKVANSLKARERLFHDGKVLKGLNEDDEEDETEKVTDDLVEEVREVRWVDQVVQEVKYSSKMQFRAPDIIEL